MKDFLLELLSIGSRLINVLRGGSADMTFSAASHVEGLGSEKIIDWAAYLITWGRERDHCRIWWEWEVERSRKNVAKYEAQKNDY